MDKLAYTRGQILFGTLLGGPLAGVYFIKKNFDAMDDADLSKKTTVIGLSLVAALFIVLPFLPEFIPGIAYAIAYAATAQSVYVQKQQVILKENPRYPHWNVAAVVALSLIAFIAICFPLIYVYYELGILVD